MLNRITISCEEVVCQLKFSYQLHSAIAGVVHRKIIKSTAAEMGITVEPEELQQTADRFRSINNLWRANDTWLWLQKHYLSLDEFEDSIYASALSSKLAQHLFNDKIEPFFVEHQLDYMQVVMYEVVLDDEDLAMELFYTIHEDGMSFHEIAHQYIQDTELRRSGGYRGVLQRKDLKPEVSAAVFAATPPQLLKPVVTSKGAHLILVEELIQPELNQLRQHAILSELFSEWLKKQAEQVDIVPKFHPDSPNQLDESNYSSSAVG